LEDGDGVLFDDLKGVGGWVVILGFLARRKAWDAEVIFMAVGVGAGDTDLIRG
jgi:hypothetical protein